MTAHQLSDPTAIERLDPSHELPPLGTDADDPGPLVVLVGLANQQLPGLQAPQEDGRVRSLDQQALGDVLLTAALRGLVFEHHQHVELTLGQAELLEEAVGGFAEQASHPDEGQHGLLVGGVIRHYFAGKLFVDELLIYEIIAHFLLLGGTANAQTHYWASVGKDGRSLAHWGGLQASPGSGPRSVVEPRPLRGPLPKMPPHADPRRPLSPSAALVEASALHLLHRFGRPFYYGIDVLCDASSENAEQFLRLTADLIDALSALLTRNRDAFLSPKRQDMLLRQAARDVMNTEWNFPHAPQVRHLVDRMAHRCLEVSLKPNAPLGAGANAFGVPQAEVESLSKDHPLFARILQFGVAYNALSLVPRYECKNKEWCLLELGGIPALHFGLTLKRGGFVESSTEELMGFIAE